MLGGLGSDSDPELKLGDLPSRGDRHTWFVHWVLGSLEPLQETGLGSEGPGRSSFAFSFCFANEACTVKQSLPKTTTTTKKPPPNNKNQPWALSHTVMLQKSFLVLRNTLCFSLIRPLASGLEGEALFVYF